MPRATRYLEEGYVYHLTHRCTDGAFFLRFSKERDTYREWLRVGVNRYEVSVLGYCVTSNHTHVVTEVCDRLAVADMMKLASGVAAQTRNRRKGHEGSVWEHPYHCTRIQNGTHLLNCLRYVDLNMVRAGRVEHPRQWSWCGYDELTGKRKRYRIINPDRLLSLTGFPSMAEFSGFYADSIAERLAAGKPLREPCWTEAVAVGDDRFLDAVEQTVRYRQLLERYEIVNPDGTTSWAVREEGTPYKASSAIKSAIQARS